jgi:hypothetical protein
MIFLPLLPDLPLLAGLPSGKPNWREYLRFAALPQDRQRAVGAIVQTRDLTRQTQGGQGVAWPGARLMNAYFFFAGALPRLDNCSSLLPILSRLTLHLMSAFDAN